MSNITKDLGGITAYADAVAGGYTGTKAQWETLMASYASVAQAAAASASAAATSATAASQSANSATTSAAAAASHTARAFNTTVTYEAGDYVVYNSQLYIFTADKGMGDWDSTKVETVYMGDELTALKEDIKDNYAKNDGYYDGMTVGNAEQIVGTVFEEDDTAYNYRTTGGSAEVGDRAYVESITGGSLVWNQAVSNGNFSNGTTNWTAASASVTLSAANNILTTTITGVESYTYKYGIIQSMSVLANYDHKFLFAADVNPSDSVKFQIQVHGGYGSHTTPTAVPSGTKTRIGGVLTSTTDFVRAFTIYPVVSGDATGMTVQYSNIVCFDLTAMFGSTIADYIYSLETAHAGDGVAWFKRYFPKPYYAYHAVGMEHVNAVAAKTVGFNQWDEEWEVGGINNTTGQPASANDKIRSKNFCKCFPSTTYYGKWGSKVSGSDMYAWFYDENESFISGTNIGNTTFTTPSNARYFKISTYGANYTTYKNDISISIHWDNSRDGDYEPYNLHTYPLADLTLRGVPLIDESGNLKFDGDRYLPDGTVERNKGIIVVDGTNVKVTAWNVTNAYDGFACYLTAPNLNPFKREYSISDRFLATSSGVSNAPIMSCGTSSGANETYSFVLPSTVTSQAEANAWFASNPTTIIYDLATPTTEEADPYQYPMVVDNWGTEELIDGKVESGDRDVAIPVGHETKYPPNLKDKLESAANNPDADGAYILTHDGGSNTYTPLASNATIQDIIARLEALEGGGE